MDLNYFKDKLFDLLNDSDDLNIVDIVTDDRRGLFTVNTTDGSTFELLCRRLQDSHRAPSPRGPLFTSSSRSPFSAGR